MSRKAWWATVHRISKSWASLKQHSMHACTDTKSVFITSYNESFIPSCVYTRTANVAHLCMKVPFFFLSLQILIYQSQNHSMYEYMPLVTSPSKYYFQKQFVLECQNFNP